MKNQVRGDRELQLVGEHLPLGFLAVKPDEEADEHVEDMSSLDADSSLHWLGLIGQLGIYIIMWACMDRYMI